MRSAGAVGRLALLFAVGTAGAQEPPLIPRPAGLELCEGQFRFPAETEIVLDDPASQEARDAARFLQTILHPFSKATVSSGPADHPSLQITQKDAGHLPGPEAYEVVVDPGRVLIRAAGAAGLFYGCQTLAQLLPGDHAARTAEIPCMKIADHPRFAWRGLMIDVSRTFFDKHHLFRWIDLASRYKLNRLHLHLTDDQGWRIEIASRPALTKIGSKFSPRFNRRGGYYTQEDIREIVRYAADRHVEVVPEIDMPGHTLAALRAYPELSCTGGPFEIYPFGEGPEIQEDVLCVGNEEAFRFATDVLTEVLDLFPSRVIHIGGDETPAKRWSACPKCIALGKGEGYASPEDLLPHFINRAARFLEERGRIPMAWDDVLSERLDPGVAVMAWHSARVGIEAAASGRRVVFAPWNQSYLSNDPWIVRAEDVLALELAVSRAEESGAVEGLEACIWTARVTDPADLETKMIPRLLALAEGAWTLRERRQHGSFWRRLPGHLARLQREGIGMEVRAGGWTPSHLKKQEILQWNLDDLLLLPSDVRCTFRYERGQHGLAIASVELLEDGVVVAREERTGFAGSTHAANVYRFRVEARRPESSYALRALVRQKGKVESHGSVWVRVLPDPP